MSVEILSNELINSDDIARSCDSDTTWYLGPFDHLLHPYVPIATLFLYKNVQTSQDSALCLDNLRIAIRRVLSQYFHLSGRLKVNESDQTLEIDLNNAGIGLFSATCSLPLSDFADADQLSLMALPGQGNDLLPPFSPSPETLSDYPLLTVQYTRFKCGAVCLGVRIFHCLCDAEGFFQLVQDIARQYDAALNETDAALEPAHLKSVQFCDVLPMSYEPLMFKANNPTESFLSDKAKDSIVYPSPVVTGKVLHFSREQLDQIKRNDNEGALETNKHISTFVALTSHLYQRLYLARRQLATTRGWPSLEALSSDILTPINWRRADRLSLPPRYFPNAVLTTTMSLRPDELAGTSLSVIARSWHDRLGCLTPADARQTLAWITAQPNKRCIVPKFRLQHGGFMISQWSNIPLYEKATFGGAVPALIAPPFTTISTIDGLGYILPSAPQQSDGSLDIYLALDADVWVVLDQDGEWIPNVVVPP